jgi:hypothetical protein
MTPAAPAAILGVATRSRSEIKMADEIEIKAECRFYALEVMFCRLLATTFRQMGAAGDAMLEETRQQSLEGARQQTFPALDPAMSDLVSAELESAIDRLLGMTKSLLETGRSSKI